MSILIKGGTIYDGSGGAPFKGDILVRGNFIAGIGSFKESKAETIIDATGTIVTPGFIDINSATDRYLYLLSDPGQSRFINMGITTVVAGTCGSSLAPLLTGSLDSLKKWGVKFLKSVNIDWQTFQEFNTALEKRGIGTNVVSLVGHHTIKHSITGDKHRNLTEKEMVFFEEVLGDAFDAGVAGVSFGLEFAHSRNVSYEEIKRISAFATKHKKLVSIHLRNPENIKESFEEVVKLAEETQANIEINHLQPPKGVSITKEYKLVREAIEDGKKSNINFDCYPEEFEIVPIYKFLPEKIKSGNVEEMKKSLKSEREAIIEHLKSIVRKKIVVAHAPPSLNFFEGKDIKSFAEDTGLNHSEALLKIMEISSLNVVCLYYNVDEKELVSFVNSKASFLGSNGINIIMPEAKSFLAFIKGASEEGIIPLEKAISKITSGPANKLKVEKRGRLKEGYYADVVVMNKNDVRDVVLNGSLAKRDYKLTGKLAGEMLKL